MVDVDSQVAQNPEHSRSQVVRPNEQVIQFTLLRYLLFWSSNIASSNIAILSSRQSNNKSVTVCGMTWRPLPMTARIVDQEADLKFFWAVSRSFLFLPKHIVVLIFIPA